MAEAREVLREAIKQGAVLANAGGHEDQLRSLLILIRDAFDAGDGVISDDEVAVGGLPPAARKRLGLE